MQLRVKLLISFVIMLMLMAAMAVVDWLGMENMSYQAKVTTTVESSMTNMILAEVRQYQYILTGSEQALKLTRKDIDEAISLSRAVSSMLTDEAALARNKENTLFLEAYRKNFDSIVALQTELNTSSAELTAMSEKLAGKFTDLLEGLRTVFIENESFNAFNAFESITQSNAAFNMTRIRVHIFNKTASPENAKAVIDQMRKARSVAITAQQYMQGEGTMTLCDEVVDLMDLYRTRFEDMSEKYSALNQLDAHIQQGLEKNLNTLRELITLSGENAAAGQRASNMFSFLVAGVSILVGVGITLLLSANVQRQLGKDPGELQTIAQRVTDGDYTIADGSPLRGVYGNIVRMVEALREHIHNATRESERAREESERAREALESARQASLLAESKTQRLVETARKLETVAGEVASSSAELAAQIDRCERGATEQAARVSETATAMDQMNATVRDVARSADAATDVSSATRERAQNGATVVRQAVDSILQVQTQASQLRGDMVHLDENAKAINQIMGVISDIADQTNLLALNAAIEAARAGEAGRGFAVVADEVRKLAEKTMASTTDVGNAIRAIQQSATQSMAQVDVAVRSVEDATGFANQSGVALKEIEDMVDNTAAQVRNIATASEEQAHSSDAINSSIAQVNGIAAETAETMRSASLAVANLTEQAHILSSLIADMKKE